MNRELNASSKQARSIFASIAVLATFLVMASIDGLSQHYGTEAQLASEKPLSVAQRQTGSAVGHLDMASRTDRRQP